MPRYETKTTHCGDVTTKETYKVEEGLILGVFDQRTLVHTETIEQKENCGSGGLVVTVAAAALGVPWIS